MRLTAISKTACLFTVLLLCLAPFSQAAPVVSADIENAGTLWKVDVTVTEGGVPVQGVCVWCTNINAFAAPADNTFKCAMTDVNGFTRYVFVGKDGVDYTAGWTFSVNTCSEFACCKLIDDPFEIGCVTYVLTATNQSLCVDDLGGVWNEYSKCTIPTGECEEYTAIALSRFDAVKMAGKVLIAWKTETEIDNAGFNIYRAEAENGAYVKINESLIPAGGSAAQGAAYSFMDDTVKIWKTYYYKLEDIDLNGSSAMHGPIKTKVNRLIGEWVSR
jgi:hypothetical protein